jgi:hypothetical protein
MGSWEEDWRKLVFFPFFICLRRKEVLWASLVATFEKPFIQGDNFIDLGFKLSLKECNKEDDMSRMNDLSQRIDDYAGEDEQVRELMTWVINMHIHGKIVFDELPLDAKELLLSWERDNQSPTQVVVHRDLMEWTNADADAFEGEAR